MTITETSRFQWPIPAWNADWLEWQGKFQDLVSNVDATTFGVMSNMQLVLKQLPNVTSAFSLGEWQLTMDADAIFVSRTLLTDTRLAAETLTLTADSVIGITLTPGAVGVQNVSWEVFTQGVPIAPEVVPLGYVDDAFNILWYNGAILVSGTTAQLFFMTGGGGGTSDMDDTHNAFGGSPAIVTIDGAEGQGDLRFRPTDAFSFVVDVASCTGASDGFSVVNGSDQFDLIRRGANDMDLDADLGEFDISALDSSFIGASGATADLSLGARGESIALNQPGDTALDAAYGAAGATSIIGAFNVLASGPGFLTDLNEGYDNFGASPAAVVINNAEGQGDLVWSPTGAFSFAVDISGVTGAADGFQITDGADQFNLTHAGVNDMDLDADLGEFNIAAASASVVTVDAGDLMLSTTTSGSLLLDGVGLVDINAGANLDIDVAGDYTIDATGLVSMQGVGASDLTIVSGDLSVQTLTSGSLILDGVALVDINAGANLDIDVVGDYTMDSTGTFSMDGVGVSNITNDGNLTVSTITSGSLVLDAVALLDINAGANLDIDVVGLVDIDATAASRFVVSGATSDLTIGARGSTVTLNQTGNTALVGFTATSIIGGMNELKTANHARSHAVTSTSDHTAGNWSIFASNGSGQVTEIGHGASGTVLKSNGTTSAPTWQSDAVNDPTLDDGYDNFGSNPATVIIDNAEEQGSLTWETHDGNDFIIDVSNSSNPFVNGRTTPYGLSVECGTDHYNVGRLADNEITVDGLIASMDIDASEYIRFDAIDSSNFSVTGGSLTISTIASGELDLTSAGLLDINAGANLDMDVTGTLAMDATSTIEWSGTNASLTSAGALTIASDFTLTGGGDIVTTANGNIDLIPNGTGITTIGGGTGSHSLNAPGDLFVSGELEVDGSTYLDGSVECIGSLTIDRSSSNASLLILSRSSIAYLLTSTYIDDGVHFGIGTTANGANRNFIFTGVNNTLKDHDHDTLSPNPTVFYHSLVDPDTDNTQWDSLTHDQTDFLIDSGTLTTKFASGLKYNVTTVNAATYDLLASDYIVHVTYTATGAVTSLTLPTAQVVSGRYVIIKDAGGNASANNITVDTQGAETIDGSATQVLSTDYEWMILYSDGSNWFVVGG